MAGRIQQIKTSIVKKIPGVKSTDLEAFSEGLDIYFSNISSFCFIFGVEEIRF